MASTPTKNSVPSENYDDLRFNAGKLDEFVTSSDNEYLDRLGVTHLTARGLQNSVAGALLPENNLSDVQSADSSLTNLGAGSVGADVFKSGTKPAARLAISAASSGANNDITSITGLTTALAVNQGGLGNTAGRAATATKLDVPRGLRVNLASTSAVNFDGSADATPGVTGTLPLTNGGLGATTAPAARASIGAKADTGVTDASSASAGQVGETMTVTGSSVTLTAATTTTLCSLALTAGDWEVDNIVSVTTSAGATSITAGNSNSATAIAASPLRLQLLAALSSGGQNLSAPRRQFSLSATTTIYLNTAVGFSSGTASAVGFMFARRIR